MENPGQPTADAIDEARISRASQAIRTMSGDLETELNETVRSARSAPREIAQRLRAITREAPLQALACAFLIGVLLTRR
jgi:ElaB/YqjD/DUF883 family membrane-anchored ribosome-binding protein